MTIEELQAEVAKLQGEVAEWKGHARTHEDRAKANADAAGKLAEAEQKIADAEAAAAAQVQQATEQSVGTLRSALVAAHGFDEAAARLLTATDPEALVSQVESIAAIRGTTPPASAPLEGTRTEQVDDPRKELIGSLFGQR